MTTSMRSGQTSRFASRIQDLGHGRSGRSNAHRSRRVPGLFLVVGSLTSLRHLAAALRDQPRGTLISGVTPEPAQRDAEAVAQADQEIDVRNASQIAPARSAGGTLDIAARRNANPAAMRLLDLRAGSRRASGISAAWRS